MFQDRLEPGVSEEKEVKLLLVLGDEVDTDYGILHSLLNVLSLQQELGEVGHTIPNAFLVLGDGGEFLELGRLGVVDNGELELSRCCTLGGGLKAWR